MGFGWLQVFKWQGFGVDELFAVRLVEVAVRCVEHVRLLLVEMWWQGGTLLDYWDAPLY